ncbi:MAG: DUF1302 domain-containing protein [Desulfocapsa sp.]|nr:DUF1302 domain-containing protein [Desulfocapsa sp.]
MKACLRSEPLRKVCKGAAMIRELSACLLLLLMASPLFAGEIDLFGGFDNIQASGKEETSTPENELSSHFSGYSKLGTSVNVARHAPDAQETDWRDLSRLRAELQLEADYRLLQWKLFASGKGSYDFSYSLNGRDRYTSQVLDSYEWEAELREAYVQGALSENLDVKLGRQIVVWGRSDNFRVTDILNPLDYREPGLTDIEDLRLPVTMSKMDYYQGVWQLSLIAVHEHRASKLPPFGSDFYPSPVPPPPEETPANSLKNTGLALEARAVFPGWDISFYEANLYTDQITIVPSFPPVQELRRINMAGAAMNAARGNFLYILEVAHLTGLRFMADYPRDYARTDLLAGLEYRGFTDTTISLDLVNRHLYHFRQELSDSPESPQRDERQTALRINRELFHDQLSLTALLILMGELAQDGTVQRFTAAYDLADNWSLTAGVIFYQSGHGAMAAVGDNDRGFLELRYDF